MRNFSLSLLLVMFAAMFMTSCDDDDDYWYSPLEGSWTIVDPRAWTITSTPFIAMAQEYII